MISFSAQQLALLDSPAYSVYLKVLMRKRPTGEVFVFADDTGAEEDKRITGATVSASIDLATMEGTVTFSRGAGTQSLSPYIGGSFYNADGPLLFPGNDIQLSCAIMPPGARPIGADYRGILFGRIDSVNVAAGPDAVTVKFRDVGGEVLNRWIEDLKFYGSAGGTLAETVMSQIVTDNGSILSVVNLGASSDFNILPYPQERMPVLEALRRIAQQIGWECRHYPRVGPILLFQDPDRARAPQFTVHKGLYLNVNKLEVSDDDVRNVWRIGYPGAPGEPPTLFLTVEDAASIAQYGRRFAEIVEDRSSNIDTLGEATTFANAALADTKDPFADFGIDLLPFPCVELNDVYTFAANGVHHDRDQQWAVVAYNHNFANGSGRTQVFTRGKPIAAYRDYRRGKRRTTHVSLNDAPTGTYLDGIDYPEGALWLTVDSLEIPT